jgi:hypothetical protein
MGLALKSDFAIQMRSPVKSSTLSGHAVQSAERSDAGDGIINHVLAFNTPRKKGGRVRLGVDFPMVRNGIILLRVCDVWASRCRPEKPLASSFNCLAARSDPLTWETL